MSNRKNNISDDLKPDIRRYTEAFIEVKTASKNLPSACKESISDKLEKLEKLNKEMQNKKTPKEIEIVATASFALLKELKQNIISKIKGDTSKLKDAIKSANNRLNEIVSKIDKEQKLVFFNDSRVDPKPIQKGTQQSELFGKDGPKIDDIRQTSNATDCIFKSSLRSIVSRHKEHIRKMFKKIGNDKYSVKLYRMEAEERYGTQGGLIKICTKPAAPINVVVSSTPIKKDRKEYSELWVSLLEKAIIAAFKKFPIKITGKKAMYRVNGSFEDLERQNLKEIKYKSLRDYAPYFTTLILGTESVYEYRNNKRWNAGLSAVKKNSRKGHNSNSKDSDVLKSIAESLGIKTENPKEIACEFQRKFEQEMDEQFRKIKSALNNRKIVTATTHDDIRYLKISRKCSGISRFEDLLKKLEEVLQYKGQKGRTDEVDKLKEEIRKFLPKDDKGIISNHEYAVYDVDDSNKLILIGDAHKNSEWRLLRQKNGKTVRFKDKSKIEGCSWIKMSTFVRLFKSLTISDAPK